MSPFYSPNDADQFLLREYLRHRIQRIDLFVSALRNELDIFLINLRYVFLYIHSLIHAHHGVDKVLGLMSRAVSFG